MTFVLRPACGIEFAVSGAKFAVSGAKFTVKFTPPISDLHTYIYSMWLGDFLTRICARSKFHKIYENALQSASLLFIGMYFVTRLIPDVSASTNSTGPHPLTAAGTVYIWALVTAS